LFIGDFNMPGVDWMTGQGRDAERLIVEPAQDKFCVQLVDFSTHIKGNILDLVLTNIPERVAEVREEGRLGNNDHSSIAIEVKVGSENHPNKQQEGRPDWARADWSEMKEKARNWNWRGELRGTSAGEAWTRLRGKVESWIETCVPKRQLRNKNRPPWLLQEILREIRKRKRMWARDKDKADKDEYKAQDKKTRNMIRVAKRKFERRLVDGVKN
jgi:hypothetical protein